MQDEQERSEQWSRILKSMRLLGGAGAILLFLALLAPVILNQLPPLVLVLALGPALLWLTTWIWEGRPPKGCQGCRPNRPVAPATQKVVAPAPDPWADLDHWRPDSCAAADFDPSLGGRKLIPLHAS